MRDDFPPPPMVRDSDVRADAETKQPAPETGTMPAGPPTSDDTRGAAPLPEKFGRYAILNALGRGAMGAVYLAHDSQLDRRVALKVPHSTVLQNPQVAERFLREAKAAAALDHPNICSVYDVGQIDDTNFIAMAYVEGQTLAALIRNNDEPLPQAGVADLVRKLALALAEAHANGVVHRDLKPANIMINKRFEPVIMDFGLALLESAGDSRLTAEGAIMGTPAYMSPEQAAGDQQMIGPASDVYALGVIMYEMLTGRLPFEGPVRQVLVKIVTEPPPPPSRFQPDVDPKLAAICTKAMNKKVEDRYASMEELAADLDAWLETSSVAERTVASGKPTEARTKSTGGGDKPSSLHLAAELLANLAARIDSGEIPADAVSKLDRMRRLPAWVWAACGVAATALLILVLLPFFGSSSGDGENSEPPAPVLVATRIQISNVYVNNVNAVFYLDGKKVTREELRKPVGLEAGQHELIVKENDRVIQRRPFSVASPKATGTSPQPNPPVVKVSPLGEPPSGRRDAVVQNQPSLSKVLSSIKVDPTLALWCAPNYSAVDSPFQSKISINGKALGTFNRKSVLSIAGIARPGWFQIVLNTTPQVPTKSREPMSFHIGTIRKVNGKDEPRAYFSFYNGKHWKFQNGRYRHQLDPEAKSMELTFHVLYAGLKYELKTPKKGDYIIESSAKWSGSNPSLTATVFVNGYPLSTFGQGKRSAVVTDLLHPGDNEIKLVTYRVDNCLTDNDVRIALKGPATYDAGSGSLTYRPVAWLSAWTGWKRNKTIHRLDSTLNPESNRIERTITVYLPEPIQSAGSLPKKGQKLVVFADKKWSGYENSLHSNLTVNGKRIARFTSDSWEVAGDAFKSNAWNVVQLDTEAMLPAYTDNYLRFSVKPVGPNASGEIQPKPALWWFQTGHGWKSQHGRLYHQSGNKATRGRVTLHLFLTDLRHENLKLAEGDYVLQGKPQWSGYLPAVTSTITVNGTRLTTFAGIKRTVVLKRPLIIKGMNEFQLETRPVESCYESNDYRFTISGPAKYSVAAGKIVPGPVVGKFSSLTGWKWDKQKVTLVNANDPSSNTVQQKLKLVVK